MHVAYIFKLPSLSLSLPLYQDAILLLMGEYKLENTKAGMVLALMEELEGWGGGDYPLSYYVDAARDYSSLEEAQKYFIQPCPICFKTYPIQEVKHFSLCLPYE